MKTIRENCLTGSKTKDHLVNDVLHHFLFRAEEDTLERRILSLTTEQTWGKGQPPVSQSDLHPGPIRADPGKGSTKSCWGRITPHAPSLSLMRQKQSLLVPCDKMLSKTSSQQRWAPGSGCLACRYKYLLWEGEAVLKTGQKLSTALWLSRKLGPLPDSD